MFAVHRLARTSPQQAARHWTRLEEGFPSDDRAYVWGMIAYLGAMRHDADALGWYARAGDLSDLQLAWKTRAALREKNWKEVLAAIDTMTEAESSDPAWRYWKARAMKALGRGPDADELLKPLAAQFNFYGQLALEDLGGRISVPATVWKPGPEDIRAMSHTPGIRRALELYRLNLRVDGNREWLVRDPVARRQAASSRPRRSPAATTCTTARSTPPTGPWSSTISACATSRRTATC